MGKAKEAPVKVKKGSTTLRRVLAARRALRREAKKEQEWLFLSFADERGFLGAVITQAAGPASAVAECRRRGVNPGGDVLVTALTDEEATGVPWSAVDTLLTRRQVKELGLC